MLFLIFGHLSIVFCTDGFVNGHQHLLGICYNAFLTDTRRAYDKEVERCVDTLTSVNTIDIGLCYGQKVKG